jgi:hypothetical protein
MDCSYNEILCCFTLVDRVVVHRTESPWSGNVPVSFLCDYNDQYCPYTIGGKRDSYRRDSALQFLAHRFLDSSGISASALDLRGTTWVRRTSSTIKRPSSISIVYLISTV